jgi:predicted PolB exonuclease-like 3'-5' exonuclease
LIVEIDEMFDQKDGVTAEVVELHIKKLRDLISMEGEEDDFKAKYQSALQLDLDAAAHQGTLKELLKT